MQTRGKRKASTDSQPPEIMSKKANGKKSESNQWVMLAPSHVGIAVTSGLGKEHGLVFHKIPHPQSGQPTLYAFKEHDVFEILKFTEKYRSWFIDESVQEDGSMMMLSPVDPILLAIPFLTKLSEKGKYMTLDQIFIDKDYQNGLNCLENCLSNSKLEKICDCRGSDDLIAYKMDMDKVISWVAKKVQRLVDHLKKSKIHVGSGSRAANFVKLSNNNSCTHAEYVGYAFGLISDYIPEKVASKIKDKLQIVSSSPQCKVEENEPPTKRQKLNCKQENDVIEDYRDQKSKTAVTKPAKLTTAQKQLAKVDKTGMKSLNSFFKPKPRKI